MSMLSLWAFWAVYFGQNMGFAIRGNGEGPLREEGPSFLSSLLLSASNGSKDIAAEYRAESNFVEAK